MHFKELWDLTTGNYKNFVVNRRHYYFNKEIIPYVFYSILKDFTKFLNRLSN